MKSVAHRHPLVCFTVLAYLGSWLLWLPLILSRNGLGLVAGEIPDGPAKLLNTLALFAGPFAAALIMTAVRGDSVKALLRRMVRFRAPGPAYLIALVVIPLVMGVAAMLDSHPAAGPGLVPVLVSALPFYVIALLGGPIPEEPGWRGFMLEHAQHRMSPVVAAVIVGLAWFGWHLPQFCLKAWDTPHHTVLDVLWFALFVVAMSVAVAWVYNVARGSLALAMLAHNGINWAGTIAPMLLGRAPSSMAGPAIGAVALAVAAIVATRGRLGYTGASDVAGARLERRMA